MQKARHIILVFGFFGFCLQVHLRSPPSVRPFERPLQRSTCRRAARIPMTTTSEPSWSDFEATLAPSFRAQKRARTVELFKQLFNQVHTALHDREIRDQQHREVSGEIAERLPLKFPSARSPSPEGNTPTSAASAKGTPMLGAGKVPRDAQSLQSHIEAQMPSLTLDTDAEEITFGKGHTRKAQPVSLLTLVKVGSRESLHKTRLDEMAPLDDFLRAPSLNVA